MKASLHDYSGRPASGWLGGSEISEPYPQVFLRFSEKQTAIEAGDEKRLSPIIDAEDSLLVYLSSFCHGIATPKLSSQCT